MKKIFIFLFLTSCLVFASSTPQINTPLGSEGNPIKIAVPIVKPFAYNINNSLQGLVISYWEAIANKHNWHYVYTPIFGNHDNIANEVSSGKFDVAIGNLSSTYQRSKYVNFSTPYLLNYVAILTTSDNKSIFSNIIRILTRSMVPILASVIGVFILASLTFWYFERRKHKYDVSESFFSTSIAMLSGNIVDTPSTNLNKFIFVCIICAGMVLQAVVIATLTDASIVIDKPSDPFQQQQDLINKTFIVDKGSSFVKIAYDNGAKVKEIAGSNQAVQYYIDNKNLFDGYITDHSIAYTIANDLMNKELVLSGYNLQYDELVFFFNKQFPYSEKVNTEILKMQDNQKCTNILRPYIGIDSFLCLL